MNLNIIALPIISAFTGWVTTWVAIKMLFHPRNPIKIFGFTLQGIFPKNQAQIAIKLGEVVSKEFLSFGEMEAKITSTDNLQKIKPLVEEHIDAFLKNKLKDVFPMISMFIGEKTTDQLKVAFVQEFETVLPSLMKSYMTNLKHDLDIEKIVQEKVKNFSSEKLENILQQITKKEFQFLEIIGGVFGFLIGILQVLITLYIK